MRYGGTEFKYAAPFADALVENTLFRKWVLMQTEFATFAETARPLHEEMKARRSAENWWRSHYTEKCRCLGCSGKETDLLAIFETPANVRFAIHFEVKQPSDKFKPDGIQSKGYPLRSLCWIANPPASVLPHHHSTTALLFSELKRVEYGDHLPYFRTLITFEQIATEFPDIRFE